MERSLKFIIKEEHAGKTVKNLLTICLGLNKRQISQAKFRKNGICLNGKQVRVTARVQINDVLSVLLEEAQEGSHQLVWDKRDPVILYEDSDLIVVQKEPGQVCHPSHGHYSDSLANQLAGYFGRRGECLKVRAIGRLDKDTSGVIVFAKNQMAAARMARQREQGIFYKVYLAVIQGKMREKKGVVNVPIGIDKEALNRMKALPEGKKAVTRYEVLAEEDGYTVVSCLLDTGRTHQIRVHMAYLGHPLVGDPIYGDPEMDFVPRTALHAWKVFFQQPFSEERICIETEIPKDFPEILRNSNTFQSKEKGRK